MVREIVFDTETTGFYPESGDRLVEIGAIELINHVPTGVTYHQYINPEREVPEEAFKVHGLSYDYLKQFPKFSEIADEWVDFVGDGILVAHNAQFDIKFVNHELGQLNRKGFTYDRVVDTLEIAKMLFPGARNNLDALCRRYNIDNTERTLHGALLDAQLLAEVYLELLGGREPSFLIDKNKKSTNGISVSGGEEKIERKFREPRLFSLDLAEIESHQAFLEKKIKGAIWNLAVESTEKISE